MEMIDEYQRPFWMPNKHLETILPALFRKVKNFSMNRERLELPDGDFLDLDWKRGKGKNLVIICHGMEGSSDRPYVLGMARAMHSIGLDVLAWNYRGCSGEINRLPRFYHSGATEDLESIIAHALSIDKKYSITLIGFSLGGNLILKYMGEGGKMLRPEIAGALAISVPLDLQACCEVIDRPSRTIYAQRFLRSLLQKVKAKEEKLPGSMPMKHFNKINSLRSFDDYITGPLHGFHDAADYYQQCSSIGFIQDIPVPTYIINALNDPFLASSCLPSPARFNNANLHLLYPKHGGHVGFSHKRINDFNVIENLAIQIWKERFTNQTK